MADTAPLVAGFVDRLGDRVRLSDRGTQVEVLRLRPELTASPLFEGAVRRRTEQLARFEHPSCARVLQIGRLAAPDGRLVIVSEAVDGWRLSEVLEAADRLREPIHSHAVIFLLRQLFAAVSSLHAAGPGLSHGALGTERLVITPDCRLVVTESVFGVALRYVPVTTPDRLWRELRLAVADGEVQPFGRLTDLRQIGVVALSLALGRQLRRDEPPARLAGVVAELARIRSERGVNQMGPALDGWLARVLSLAGDETPWSVADAQRELSQIVQSDPALSFEPTGLGPLLQRVGEYYADDDESLAEPAAAVPPRPSSEPVSAPARRHDPGDRPPDVEPHAEAVPADAVDPAPAAPVIDPPAPALVSRQEPEAEELSQPPFMDVALMDQPAEPAAASIAEQPSVPIAVAPAQEPTPAPLVPEPVQPPVTLAAPAPPVPAVTPPRLPEPVVAAAAVRVPAAPPRLPEPVTEPVVSHSPLAPRRLPEPVAEPTVLHPPAAPPRLSEPFAEAAVLRPPVAARPAHRDGPESPAGSIHLSSSAKIPGHPVAEVVTVAESIRPEPFKIPTHADVDRPRHEATPAADRALSRPMFGVDLSEDSPKPVQRPAKKRVGLMVGLGTAALVIVVAGGYPLLRSKTVAATSTAPSQPAATAPAPPSPTASAPAAPAPPLPAPAAPAAPAPAPVAAPSEPANGLVEVVSPLVLDVSEGGRALGTSAQPIRLPLGRHTLEVTRADLGYRTTHVVDVREGRREQVRPSLPNGEANLNATPWAEVFIDGRSFGETPLGNVQLTIGPHEVKFRHPDFGEQTRTLVVTSGAVARLSVELKK